MLNNKFATSSEKEVKSEENPLTNLDNSPSESNNLHSTCSWSSWNQNVERPATVFRILRNFHSFSRLEANCKSWFINFHNSIRKIMTTFSVWWSSHSPRPTSDSRSSARCSYSARLPWQSSWSSRGASRSSSLRSLWWSSSSRSLGPSLSQIRRWSSTDGLYWLCTRNQSIIIDNSVFLIYWLK